MHILLGILDVVGLLLLIWFWSLIQTANTEGTKWDTRLREVVTIIMLLGYVTGFMSGAVIVILAVMKERVFFFDYLVYIGLIVTLLCITCFERFLPQEQQPHN